MHRDQMMRVDLLLWLTEVNKIILSLLCGPGRKMQEHHPEGPGHTWKVDTRESSEV